MPMIYTEHLKAVVIPPPRDRTTPALPAGVTELVHAGGGDGVYRSQARSLELRFGRRLGLTLGAVALIAVGIALGIPVLRGHAKEWGDYLAAPSMIAAGIVLFVLSSGGTIRLSVDGLQLRSRVNRLELPVAQIAAFHTVQHENQRRDMVGGNMSATTYRLVVRTHDGEQHFLRGVRTADDGWALEHRLMTTLEQLPRG